MCLFLIVTKDCVIGQLHHLTLNGLDMCARYDQPTDSNNTKHVAVDQQHCKH